MEKGNRDMTLVASLLVWLGVWVLVFHEALGELLGANPDELLGGHVARTVIAFALVGLAIWLNRRWWRRSGRMQPGERFGTKPETFVAVPLLLAGFLLPNLLGTRGLVSWLIVLGTLIGFVLLMLRADLMEPERRAAERDARGQGWSGPFE